MSDVVGLVVLLAMTILVVAVVVTIGAQSIGQVQTEVEFQQSEVVAMSFIDISAVWSAMSSSSAATPIHYDHALESVTAIPESNASVGGVPLNKHTASLDYFYLRAVILNATAG